ncbi:arsenate reductase [Anaerolineales bacterium]|nr:arsenate reductase [Anaerolineales bacterium]
MDNKLLFICTGNYYRSRYAEIFFNDLALKKQINWQASSRGLAADEGHNVGPIAPHVLKRLKLHGIPLNGHARFPMQLEEKDLLDADLIISLDRHVHQPMMTKQFPAWADQITYWDVPDLNIMDSDSAFAAIEKNIYATIEDVR